MSAGDGTEAPKGTLVRTADDEKTVRDQNTVLRTELADSNETTIRPPDSGGTGTLVSGGTGTLVSGGTGTLVHGETAARTLQSPQGAAPAAGETLPATAAQYAPTRERTLMGDRRAEYLDDEPRSSRGPLQAGSVVKSRFVLDTLIGKGGMGLVFSAIDRRKEEARDPNPRVALKVLSADFQRHPQAFIALQREARKAQTLAHPNVVTVFDFDRDQDTVFMTMELLKGRSLDSLVREVKGKGTGREIALPIIRGIAEGLAYAHRKGIVHSDLKPGNVFLTEDSTPKILDFGIARAVPSATASTEARDEFDAGSLGAYTEAYATSEMIEGVDPHPADDLYALGIIGYELLIGRHPYKRLSAPAADKERMKPPPLKGLKMREARALERCLSFDRNLRPKDAGEFLKLFRGVTALQKGLMAATAVLALVSGYLYYDNYRETAPAIPFAQLPVETRQEFTKAMTDGDEAWNFYLKDHNNFDALSSSIDFYTQAYAKHPRNRDAVKALKKVAEVWLKVPGGDAERRKQFARNLEERSEYYKKYSPVVDAAGE
jgi:serine/threonine protein kinase